MVPNKYHLFWVMFEGDEVIELHTLASLINNEIFNAVYEIELLTCRHGECSANDLGLLDDLLLNFASL